MKIDKTVLHLTVGEPVSASFARATAAMKAARQLKRDYKNVHSDCERLVEWMAIEKDGNGLVFAPYDEIVVDMKLPERRAA